ncbi:hypothetical protein PI125_g685 [Phytophthora idaei]|nr:hypothetical protein PI125_g685 [Phytophthora idaei]KAG3158634.1 hypothetical protein PI126_g7778 [Phytophthora idaei]
MQSHEPSAQASPLHRATALHSETNTAAIAAWLRLFQVPAFQSRHHRNQADRLHAQPLQLPAHAKADVLSPVGGNYEFFMPQQWPIGVARIERSVFSSSKPYPVIVTLTYGDEVCEREGCCVSNTGSHITSPCLNVNTATVCSQNNCLFGPACGNRFEPRLPLDLVESRAGLSVVSSNQIPEGAFIVEYVGEILYEDDVIERTDRRYQANSRQMPNGMGALKCLWTPYDARADLSFTHVDLTAHYTGSCGRIRPAWGYLQ